VRALLEEYAPWLCRAARDAGPAALEKGPVLILTGSSAVQEQVFCREVEQIRAFGAVAPGTPLQATAYRRWINHSWKAVEPEGQPQAGSWSETAEARLRSLVRQAHQGGLWIRIYTVNGANAAERSARGWFKTYSFSSMEQARRRWQAMADAGVDYIASDQYGELAHLLAGRRDSPRLAR
jgi:glycerophosphoryl diester phosphodiesterase